MCDNRCEWVNLEEGETRVIIINSKKELDNYLVHNPYYINSDPCPQNPFDEYSYRMFDFSKHSLLLVQGWAIGGGDIYTTPEEYLHPPLPEFRQLSPNEFLLIIEMRLINKNIYEQWNRAFIVKKLSDASIVKLDVTIQLEDEWEVIHDETASIIGKWKLVEERISGFSGCIPRYRTDYSQSNVEYEFKRNGVLTISGDAGYPIWPKIGDHFYSFIEGSHVYRYDYYLEIGDPDYSSYFQYRISSEQLAIDQRFVDGNAYYFVK